MVARIAKSQTGTLAQYVGTTRTAQAPGYGAAFVRGFNGTTDRMVGPRAVDLGSNFMVSVMAARAAGTILFDDMVSARIFTQPCVGGTRVGFGINRSFVSLVVTNSSGVQYVVESKVTVLNTQVHSYALVVKAASVELYFDGRLAIEHSVTLTAPATAQCTVGSDAASRFFAGSMHDMALFATLPPNYQNWIKYQRAVFKGVSPRDAIWGGFSSGFNSVVLTGGAMLASGSLPTSRVGLTTTFSAAPELPEQVVEFYFSTLDPDAHIGVFTSSHDLATQALGTTPHSLRFTQDGFGFINDVQVASGFDTWTKDDVMALKFQPTSMQLSLLKNGVSLTTVTLPAGVWTAGLDLGVSDVRLNTGAWVSSLTAPEALGLPSKLWSRLTTEFRHLRLGEVSAPMDDTGTDITDARTGTVYGVRGSVAVPQPAITSDSFDTAVLATGGITMSQGLWTVADDSFFAGLAFSPTAADLTGTHVLLECGDKWGLKLVDNVLIAWVGNNSASTFGGAALEEGKRYWVGMALQGGIIKIWSAGFFGKVSTGTVNGQVAADVTVGSAAAGADQWQGRLSHLVLSSTVPADWKLARLNAAESWEIVNWDGPGYGRRYGRSYGKL